VVKFIFSTGSLYFYGVDRCFDFAARAGFDGIELMVDQRWDTRQPEHLHRLVEQYNLPVLAVHSPFFFSVPGWPSGQGNMLPRSVELAEALGAPVVIHHLPLRTGYAFITAGPRQFFLPTFLWNRESRYRRWLLEEYPALQAATPVRLCIENMPARRMGRWRIGAHHWNTVGEITRFPHLTLDTTHLGTWDLDPVEVYERWRGRAGHIHLSNFDGREHRLPEHGRLRLDRLVARLAETGYSGAVSLELHPDALQAGEADDHIVHLLATSLGHCRRWAGAG
jgi:sugar phosphate isomerase/epimerase